MGSQLARYGTELAAPVTERDVVKAGGVAWDIITGLGIKEGVIPTVRALVTLFAASTVAIGGAAIDRMRRH